jgi:S-adenosylmethionine:tRNA ribosyltransferase-isomerase
MMPVSFPYRTGDFDYNLPPELIAQTPLEPRDHSRLMVLDRKSQNISHHHFYDITGFLQPGDVLVFNESRVIPARIHGNKTTGARVELLLIQKLEPCIWRCLARPAKRLAPGSVVNIKSENSGEILIATVVDREAGGTLTVRFSDEKLLREAGEIALPPYIHTPLVDKERYQTVYARSEGSVAAPTAGLHFTRELIQKIEEKGIKCCKVTLHVGLDTFQPVREDDPSQHVIHREWGMVEKETADIINRAAGDGRRIIAVGTTSVRILEHVASAVMPLKPFSGRVDLYILPGYNFKITSAMITNFHLPKTTLLMLVSAFAGKDFIQKAYNEAIEKQYRFYSFGDAMLIL